MRENNNRSRYTHKDVPKVVAATNAKNKKLLKYEFLGWNRSLLKATVQWR